MPDVVVPDTSCLIALTVLGRLDLLRNLHHSVVIPTGVAEEYGERLPDWISVMPVANVWLVKSLRAALGKGEAEVISLATQLPEAVAVLDDERARREARGLGLPITGTLGLLVRAKREGLLPSLADAIGRLDAAGFRVSYELRQEVLKHDA
jgi:predicted nucleic acid-binding protein